MEREENELYCPQCAMEGNLRRLKGVCLIKNGKICGYFCPKHGMVPNPVSETQAKNIMKAAEEYERQFGVPGDDEMSGETGNKPSKKEKIFSYIKSISDSISDFKSISEGRLVESIFYFLSFLLIGALTTRVPNSPSIWIFVLYGLAALSINLFMRVDD